MIIDIHTQLGDILNPGGGDLVFRPSSADFFTTGITLLHIAGATDQGGCVPGRHCVCPGDNCRVSGGRIYCRACPAVQIPRRHGHAESL